MTVTRRQFLRTTSLGAAALGALGGCAPAIRGDFAPRTPISANTQTVRLHVNGAEHGLTIEPRTSLLDALREHLGITGAKEGCNQGACGACTVLANGERTLSCLALTVQYEDISITTIEGLVDPDGHLHPMQAAFIRHDGFQCGYCTPGQICSALGMLREHRRGVPSAVTPDMAEAAMELTDAELKERMSGNLCRCGAYVGIHDAIRDVVEQEASR